MEFNDIVSIVSNVGFPIAMCVYMTLTVNKTLQSLKDTVEELVIAIRNKGV